jgi:hypothetical protein
VAREVEHSQIATPKNKNVIVDIKISALSEYKLQLGVHQTKRYLPLNRRERLILIISSPMRLID